MSTFDFTSLCRICLTKTQQMTSLNTLYKDVVNITDQNSETISDVLVNLFNLLGKTSEKYPQCICPMCLDILKAVYDFKVLLQESTKIIRSFFEDDILEENSNFQSEATVELIAGSKKYNLKDLVIVEDEDSADENRYEGFLKNLGKTVTASFINDTRSLKSLPQVEVHEMFTSSDSDDSLTPVKTRNRSNSLDEYILVDGVKIQESEAITTEDNLQNLENIDKDILESVLNLKFECQICKKVFAREARYQKHVEVCGLEYKIKNNNKGEKVLISKLQCQYCMKKFKRLKYLNSHINVSHKTMFYSCEICKIDLKSKRAYDYHKITKHSNVKHICHYCGKSFAVLNSLKLHLEIHTNGDKPQCVCPVCGKTFHYKGGLFYHMKQHTNERKYQCEHCDRNFYTLFAKKRHVRTHTGVRPYACQYCDKMFFSSGEKKRHEYIHTGTLPYRCQYCDKGFTSNYNMKVHWFNHSGDYRCEICNKAFIDNIVLQFHCKLKHKAVNEDGV